MLSSSFHRKFISKVLVLAYLLIGSGVGDALLWCQESEAFTHLEYNLSGSCQNTCEINLEDSESAVGATPSEVVENVSTDCLDSPVSLSHVPTEKIHPPLDGDASAWSISPTPAKDFSSVAFLARLNLSAQPPPSLALVTLRTVVLLN